MPREYSQTIQDAPSTGEIKEVMPISNSRSAVTQPIKITTNGGVLKKSSSKKLSTPKKSYILSQEDSIKLNIIRVKPTTNGYFDNNILTRTLQPIGTLNQDRLEIKIDSINAYLPMEEVFKKASSPVASIIDVNGASTDSTVAIIDTLPKPITKIVHTTAPARNDETLHPSSSFQDSKMFLFLIVLFSVALLGYVRLKSTKFIQTIFKALISHHESKKLFTTVNVRNSLHSVMLDLLFIFNIGILTYEVVSLFMNSNGLLMSLLVFGGSIIGVATYFLLKVSIFRAIGYIFSTTEETNEYLFFVGLVNKAFGIILTPFLILLPFSNASLTYVYLGIALFLYVSLLIVQVMRGFVIILQKPVSLFYFILYICTLEILPVIIAIRIFNK